MTFDLSFRGGPGSYRWWYLDAISDDGEKALVAIFFIGSVFSPHYARRRDSGEIAHPEDHIAINVALYEKGRRVAWVFSEYGRHALTLAKRRLRVEKSALSYNENGGLEIDIDDITVARRKRLNGLIRVEPLEAPLTKDYVTLADGHEWRAHVPRARVTANFRGFDFSGTGYHDENRGIEPIEKGFSSWSWGRFHDGPGTRVFFDTESRGTRTVSTIETGGLVNSEKHAARIVRPSLSNWLLPVPTSYVGGRSANGSLRIVQPTRVIDRAPFYVRFLASSARDPGAPLTLGMAEHLSLERTTRPIVRRMVNLRLALPELGYFGRIP